MQTLSVSDLVIGGFQVKTLTKDLPTVQSEEKGEWSLTQISPDMLKHSTYSPEMRRETPVHHVHQRAQGH